MCNERRWTFTEAPNCFYHLTIKQPLLNNLYADIDRWPWWTNLTWRFWKCICIYQNELYRQRLWKVTITYFRQTVTLTYAVTFVADSYEYNLNFSHYIYISITNVHIYLKCYSSHHTLIAVGLIIIITKSASNKFLNCQVWRSVFSDNLFLKVDMISDQIRDKHLQKTAHVTQTEITNKTFAHIMMSYCSLSSIASTSHKSGNVFSSICLCCVCL